MYVCTYIHKYICSVCTVHTYVRMYTCFKWAAALLICSSDCRPLPTLCRHETFTGLRTYTTYIRTYIHMHCAQDVRVYTVTYICMYVIVECLAHVFTYVSYCCNLMYVNVLCIFHTYIRTCVSVIHCLDCVLGL